VTANPTTPGAAPANDAPDVQALFDVAHWISSAAPYLAVLVALAGAAWAIASLCRASRVRTTLADRVAVEVVPTSTFDPSESMVSRWAHQLSRARYAAAGAPPRGAGTRLRYTARDGKMRCLIEGPAAAGAVLTLPGFAEVDVRADTARHPAHSVRFPTQKGIRQ
jgi:hypothetical protein